MPLCSLSSQIGFAVGGRPRGGESSGSSATGFCAVRYLRTRSGTSCPVGEAQRSGVRCRWLSWNEV
jgi:hypothetical protein